MSAMPLELDARFRAAQRVARDAGELALDYFGKLPGLVVESKGTQDRVSEADRAVESFIENRLRSEFPDDGFLGEEGGHTAGPDAQYLWVVDPIDGTDCFVNGIPVWSISIALLERSRPAVGVVYDPNANELFAAGRGLGANLNGAAVHASQASDFEAGIVGVGYSHRVEPGPTLAVLRRLLEAGGIYQRNGSGALMLAYVAAGRLIGYYEAHINAWDALAGILLVHEAGGWTNDFLAGDGLEQGNELMASGPRLAERLRTLCAASD